MRCADNHKANGQFCEISQLVSACARHPVALNGTIIGERTREQRSYPGREEGISYSPNLCTIVRPESLLRSR